MEHRMNLPILGNVEMVGCVGNYLSISNGLVLFIWSFFGLFIWRLVVSSQTLSPSFHGENLEKIHSFIRCWAILCATWASSRAEDNSASLPPRLDRKVFLRVG